MKKITFSLIFILSIFTILAQNECNTAINITTGTYNIDVINGVMPLLNCTNNTNGNNAEWYKYTATNDIQLTVTTDLPDNIGIDTRFNVFTGTCENLVCVGGDDDSGSGYLSIKTFNVTTGSDYYIAFDNRWNPAPFIFEVFEAIIQPPSTNDVSFTTQTITNLGSPYAIIDMNNDDLDDVVTTNALNVLINYQKPDGTFDEINITTPLADHNATWSMAAGDLDGNGFMDLLYGGGQGATIMYGNKLFSDNPNNDYTTSFTEYSPTIYIFSQRTNFVDINNDGLLDAFVCHDVDSNVYFINNGNGGLETHQVGDGNSVDLGLPGSNYATIFFDYDNDHNIDMHISKCTSEPNRLYHNNGDGTYTDVTTTSGLESLLRTWASATGDFNNDGYMDVLIGASSGNNGLMRNNGDGTFTDVTIGSGFDNFYITSHEYIAEDFNNDGFIDILSSGTIMLNNGNMTFTPSVNSVGEGAIGDVNNDGFLDVMSFNGLNINNNTTGNWFNVNLTGVQSNLDGIGARVEITSALGVQIRDVKSGVGFKHMSSLTSHFGLGEDTIIENITVYWPSGVVDSINNPTINSSINITENSTALSIDQNIINNVVLYPNPTTNKLKINSTINLENSIITIFDLQGKKLYNGFYNSNDIDVSNFESGLYILRIIKNNKQANLKFIKK